MTNFGLRKEKEYLGSRSIQKLKMLSIVRKKLKLSGSMTVR